VPKQKRTGKPNEEPQWKLVERVVATLEKGISPSARVLHDVKLPDITTGHLRQCDVVIEAGKEPRVTRTLVEVQKRRTRMKIGKLNELWQKMHAVGAQHLICVSALDFPKSVMDEVAIKLGPSVKLLRLRELPHADWPLKFVSGYLLPTQFRDVTLDKTRPPIMMLEPGRQLPADFRMNEERPIFQRSGTV